MVMFLAFARLAVAQEKKCDGDAEDRSGDHGAHPEEEGIDETLKIEGIREKAVKVRQGEDPLVGGEGIIKETNQGIDQEKAEEGPDPSIAEQTANLNLGPKAGLRNRHG